MNSILIPVKNVELPTLHINAEAQQILLQEYFQKMDGSGI